MRWHHIVSWLLVVALCGTGYVVLRHRVFVPDLVDDRQPATPPRSSGSARVPRDGVPPLVGAARRQIGVTTGYDPSYRSIGYPLGDVPESTGVCADVVVRAFRQREQRSLDLQQAVHDDMQRHFDRYPKRWGLKRPDANIDHRRVPNLMTYFQRQGWGVGITADPRDYRAGDIVAWTFGAGLTHIGIVSDRSSDETPLIIHNIGQGAREEDILFRYAIIGHYRPVLRK